MKSFRFLVLAILSFSFMASQGHAKQDIREDLAGTYLSISYLKDPRRQATKNRCRKYCKITKRASRIYLDPIPGEANSYHAVFLEYVDLLKMFPKYAAPKVSTWISDRIGYLNEITSKIWVFKVVPVDGDPNKYAMIDLRVEGDQIVPQEDKVNKFLVLSDRSGKKYPLENATIEGVGGKVWFPKRNWMPKGTQWFVANRVYNWPVKLNSTWRKDFLPGPYLAAYEKPNDVVLSLMQDTESSPMSAEFFESEIGKAFTQENSLEDRQAIFTHPESAGFTGDFKVSEPINGMFLFQNGSQNLVENRIGLFIDVFDATERLGQDVVELALINPEDPSDFLMYYEDPENGEGR